MRAAVRVGGPIVIVVAVLVLAACAVFEGVTEPAHHLFGLSSRHADIVACWVIFLVLPALGALDALMLDTARWSAAERSKPAWVAMIAFLPVAGVVLYVTVARPVVSSARPDRPPRVAYS